MGFLGGKRWSAERALQRSEPTAFSPKRVFAYFLHEQKVGRRQVKLDASPEPSANTEKGFQGLWP